MNRTAAIALVLAASFISSGVASAQDHQVKANVPFNFSVGDRTMTAGTYTIGSDINSPSLLNVRSKSGQGMYAMGSPNQANPNHENVLVFHKYGDQYYLSEIRTEAADLNVHFAPSKEEKRARTQALEAGNRVDGLFMLALNQ